MFAQPNVGRVTQLCIQVLSINLFNLISSPDHSIMKSLRMFSNGRLWKVGQAIE